jgi:hypothetical protein
MSVRIQFEVTDEVHEQLTALGLRLGCGATGDLLNNAITLLEWAEAQISAGRVIASVDDVACTWKEVQMPVFANVRRRAA